MICLETKRMLLRDYRPKDIVDYFQLKNDKETMYYLQDISVKTQKEADLEFEEILKDQEKKDRTWYFLHMEDKDTCEQIGSIGYTVLEHPPVGKLVHLGYFTYPKFWGKGYTSEALLKVMEYAFEIDQVYRIQTGCLKENIGSEKVMIKCKMTKEAEHIEWEWHEGKMKDRVEYRMLRSEWESLRGNK